MNLRACPICSSTEIAPLYRRDFAKLSGGLIAGYTVVACGRCGFCFASDLPSQSEFDLYYRNQSKYEYENRAGAPSNYEIRRLPLSVRAISEWLPNRAARILDIGCANGGLLNALKTHGYSNVFGADPSPACARIAKELYDIEVTVASLFQIPEALGSFDLVILGSVLEHILDLNEAVIKISQLLNPGGYVYVEVPDMTRCSSLNDAPFQEFSVEHINFFGKSSLRNLWQKHGFVTLGLKQEEIEQTRGLTVYEIKGMFQKTDGVPADNGITIGSDTKPEILRYIARSREKLEHVQRVVDALAASQEPIVVWGVGTHTQSLLATTKLKEANIRAFVDSNARYVGQQLNNIPILRIDKLKEMREPILVSSQQFQDEIVASIRQTLKLPNKLITLYSSD